LVLIKGQGFAHLPFDFIEIVLVSSAVVCVPHRPGDFLTMQNGLRGAKSSVRFGREMDTNPQRISPGRGGRIDRDGQIPQPLFCESIAQLFSTECGHDGEEKRVQQKEEPNVRSGDHKEYVRHKQHQSGDDRHDRYFRF